MTDNAAPFAPLLTDPTWPVEAWPLTERDRAIYEAGFISGYLLRQPEIDQAEADADRYYRALYNQPNQPHRQHRS